LQKVLFMFDHLTKKSCLLLCVFLVRPASAQDVACLGRIEPGERVIQIAAPANSIVGELRVRRGDKVAAGDVIALLREAPVYRAQLERAERQVAQAEAELSQIRTGERPELIRAQEAVIAGHAAEARLLETRLDRYGVLLRDQHIDQDRYDEIDSGLHTLKARLQREQSVLESLRTGRAEEVLKAEIGVSLAQAQAAEAGAALELQHIRAPFAGEILDIHAWPGESTGDDGALASLGDTANMMVVADVYESDLPRVEIGQLATFRGQAFAGEMSGRVTEIQKMFETSRIFPLDPSAYVDRRIVAVRILPDNPETLAAFSRAHVVVTIHTP
jgi:HlyD family secretion protein